MIVFDTNIIIYYIQEIPNVVNWVDKAQMRGEELAVSAMTLVELFSYPNITHDEIFAIERWCNIVFIVDVDVVIARQASLIRRNYNLTAVDSVIAASAMILSADLITNDAIFKRVPNINVIVP